MAQLGFVGGRGLDHHVRDDLRGVADIDPLAHQVFAARPFGGIRLQRLVGMREIFFERRACYAGLDQRHANAKTSCLVIERFRVA